MKTIQDHLDANEGDIIQAEIAMWVDLNREVNLPAGPPRTLANIAEGQGKAARRARAHIAAGKDPNAQLDLRTGRWK